MAFLRPAFLAGLAGLAAIRLAHGEPPSGAAATPKPPSDAQINLAVETRFEFDKVVPWDSVEASTVNGVVTLQGTAKSLLERQRATLVAQTVRGVRAVVNTISVKTGARSDAEIFQDIAATFNADPATATMGIKAVVVDGVVTLSGKVDAFRDKQLARHAAEEVNGVRDVKEMLQVDFAAHPKRPDAEIAADIRAGLERDAWINATFVNAEVQNGKATLTGQIATLPAKERAESLAWVDGVQTVDANGLSVEAWLGDKMRRPPGRVPKTDAEITSAVRAALHEDPRLAHMEPQVAVSGGIVTLSGKLTTIAGRKAAEMDARSAYGAWDVRNLLKVRSTHEMADDLLALTVKAALQRHSLVSKLPIEVTAVQGKVTLKGIVDSEFEKTTADEVVDKLDGVTAVTNRLVVANPELSQVRFPWEPDYTYDLWPGHAARAPFKSDMQIKLAIEDELRWSPWVGDETVEVSMKNGIATLTGTVQTWMEFAAAGRAAMDAGAAVVHNDLTIE